jgi:uncharacterized membrane protein
MKEAMKSGDFYYEAAATVRKDADGSLHYHETGDMSTAKGAGIGAIIGGIVGVLAGPAGVALGAGAGAAIGGAVGHKDKGFRDSSLDQIGTALSPGSSAVLVITSKEFLHEFRKQVSDADLWPMVRSIGESISEAQMQGQDMVLGILVTETGFAVKRLAFDDTSAQVFGIVATDEGAAVGEAYADETGVIYQVTVADDQGAATETGVATDNAALIVDDAVDNEGNEEIDITAAEVVDDGDESPDTTA